MRSTDLPAFLSSHRAALLERWAYKVSTTLSSESWMTEEQLRNSLPLFIDEIIEGLERQAGKLVDDKKSALARVHGSQRETLGRGVADLVREYGLFFESVVELALEEGKALDPADVLELSKCLYTGAAEAVDEYAVQSEAGRKKAELLHFGFVAHELRNPLWSARMAWDRVRGDAEKRGRSADVLSRNLARLSELVDETLSVARLAELGSTPIAQREAVSVVRLLQEAQEDSRGDAEAKDIALHIEADETHRARGDHRLLLSALTNLVRNAVKFTHEGGGVTIRSRVADTRLVIEVQDECGGLPPERAERLFEAFTQANKDRRGFGLGLAISKQAVEAQGGTLTVKNVPDSGCIFVLELARDGDGDEGERLV